MCSSWTGALVCVDQIDAGASILTGLGLTLIDLFGAVYSMVPRDTLTGKTKCPLMVCNVTRVTLYLPSKKPYLTTVASQIISTCGSILARIW